MHPKEVTKRVDLPIDRKKLSPLSTSIIKTLLYFDIFDHPLHVEELMELSSVNASKEDFSVSLEELTQNNKISFSEGFYYVSDKPDIVNKRKNGNLMAERYFKIAQKVSTFISWFPFVRCVCISGTLSKNHFDKNSDIDYFIITEPGRLWLCRTMLIAFKKIFLLNSKKYFCVNYFIDSDSLEIPDKNIFTATELVHVKPTYNAGLYDKFIAENNWVRTFYPNKKNSTSQVAGKSTILKGIAERILLRDLGETLDKWCFSMTIKNWKKKFPGFSDEQFDLNLRSRRNVSKHHPQGFQFKVLQAYSEKIKEFEEKFDTTFA